MSDDKLLMLEEVAAIVGQSTLDSRYYLDGNFHALELSYKSLIASKPTSMSDEVFKQHHDLFIDVIENKNRITRATTAFDAITLLSVGRQPGMYKTGASVVYVKSIKTLFGISYGTLQDFLSNAVKNVIIDKNTNTLKKEYTGTLFTSTTVNEKGVHTYTSQIGHTGTGTSKDSGNTTPTAQLFFGALEQSTSPLISAEIYKAIRKLSKLHIKLGLTVEKQNITSASNILGEIVIRCSLQSAYLNGTQLAQEEKRIKNELYEKLNSPKFRNRVIKLKGSNSIEEDIAQLINQTLDPKIKSPKLPKHNKGKELKRELDVQGKVSGSPRIGGKLAPKVTSKVLPSNLSNLQIILNQKLRDQIEANMGTGDSKSILNFRTGRFANSVQVQRLTESKEGMISAFYTYMKYPYQTFEPGFAQGSPKTRDPKLLIAKSIRDIASTVVSNRLRSILV